ncbi:hypothetical protein YC6258_05494 [Gynuella sunshinyii YC6258]|uniref:Rhs element Vgr protein n=2 Tax=Gynuella sunshinyii TaxID=1445505 RepID=A0A0C5VS78_9GAMM|nr:hypothetical protein YC6258_05494 [Gynuella sunshinyii YC6258]
MKPGEFHDIGLTRLANRDADNLYLHLNIWLADGRQVGRNYFRLHQLQGQEAISSPFEFQLQLRGNTDPDSQNRFTFEQFIGRPATVAINLASAEDQGQQRFDDAIAGAAAVDLSCFNGIIADFGMSEPGVYHATLKPALWRLSLTNRYHIHKHCNIRDAIAGVLKEHDIHYSVASLNHPDNPAVARVQDWLQAGESDLDFITRLMSKAYLFYYFVHTGDRHTLVLANQAGYPEVYPNGETLRYCQTNIEAQGLDQERAITQYQYKQSLSSSSVTGVFVRQENAWEQDTVADFQSYPPSTQGTGGTLPFNLYRIYQYGVNREEVDTHVNAQRDRLNTSATDLSGASHCPLFHCGYRFTLSADLGNLQNPQVVRPSLEGRSFVLTQVQHQCSLDGQYQNSFKATESDGLITPFSLQDTHQGSILARVEEHVKPDDWRYYDKDNFDPQNEMVDGYEAQQSHRLKGVYVRFSTDQGESDKVWVKLAPHMQTVPEVGVMVWVSRSNDDSELPEIQSIVQANGNRTVTPSRWTASTNVGSSHSTSYGDSKSIRFGLFSKADLNVAVSMVEQRYQQGHQQSDFSGSQQCNGQKFKDVSYSQGAGYNYSTSESGRSGLLGQSESYGCNYSHSEGAEVWSYSDYDHARNESYNQNTESYSRISGKTYSESTIGESESHSTITGDSRNYHQALGLSYNQSLVNRTENQNIAQGSSTSLGVNLGPIFGVSMNMAPVMNSNTTISPTTSVNTNIGSTTSSAVHMGSSLSSSLQLGSSTSSNTQVGTQTSISSMTDSTSVNSILSQTQASVTGMSTRGSMTGMDTGASMTGVQGNMSITGVSSGLSVTGIHSAISVVGDSTSINVTGASTNISVTAESMMVDVNASGVKCIVDNRIEAKVEDLNVAIQSLIKLVL